VLPFTTDEVWPLIPGFSGSVHLALFPEGEAADKALLERWEALIEARALVTKALEEARAARQIAASLEARVELRGSAQAIAPLRDYEKGSTVFPGNLANLLIVSRVDLREGAGPLTVRVERAAGGKCERCWTYSEKVGKLSVHPGVCERCADVLQERR
jgi:isoleucyl-tRNA synthetase